MKSGLELSLVIPLYNEEKNVTSVLKSLTSTLNPEKINYEIIAVDNGSWDKTGSIITKFSKTHKQVKKLRIDVNQGYGYGINKGLKACKGKYIGYLWGDNQIKPEVTLNVYKTLKYENMDLCKIKRVKRTESWMRKVESKVYNAIMKVFFGIDSADVNGCPKIMRKTVYTSLHVNSKDWFIDAEIMIKCRKKHYKVKEIPVLSGDRKSGKSNVNWKTTVEFAKNIFKYKLVNK